MPRWKPAEESYLREHAGDGALKIAQALGRTAHSVQCKASSMGISLFQRWHCPNCGRYTYTPLSERSGWCRKCSIEASADTAAVKNRQIRLEIERERRTVEEAKRRRQMIYSDTNRRKKELRSLRELRERNEKSEGEG